MPWWSIFFFKAFLECRAGLINQFSTYIYCEILYVLQCKFEYTYTACQKIYIMLSDVYFIFPLVRHLIVCCRVSIKTHHCKLRFFAHKFSLSNLVCASYCGHSPCLSEALACVEEGRTVIGVIKWVSG